MNDDYDDDTGDLIAKIADRDAEIKRLEERCKELEADYIKTHSVEYVAEIVKPYEEKIKELEFGALLNEIAKDKK